jgi:hypothetical protein
MDRIAAKESQAAFLKKIEDILPLNSSLVNEIADILQISADSAYRRMRGETFLSIDEILMLSDHFKVTFDTGNYSGENAVTFRYSAMNADRKAFVQYLSAMLRDLEVIARAPNHFITYACEDIPIFHNFAHPLLASFKIYYWMQAILNVPELAGEKFDTVLHDNELLQIGSRIFELYSQIPSLEIWTDTTLTSTIKQIEYFWEAGRFYNKQDALSVCKSLRDEIDLIQRQAEVGSKIAGDQPLAESKQGNYQLYFSEIEITNNSVLVDMGTTHSVYLGHLTFNTMTTFSDKYCADTRKWLDVIVKKSVLISGVSEKQRYQVFRKYFAQIEALENRINES